MFPVIEYIKTCLNGLRSRIEKVEKSISQALASVKEDIIQDIKNVRKESAETIKSSTADWNQNDPDALNYVKNRPMYSYQENVGTEYSVSGISSNPLPLVFGEEWYVMGTLSGEKDRYLPNGTKTIFTVRKNSSGDLCIASDLSYGFSTGSEASSGNRFIIYSDHIYENASWKAAMKSSVSRVFRLAEPSYKIAYKTIDANLLPMADGETPGIVHPYFDNGSRGTDVVVNEDGRLYCDTELTVVTVPSTFDIRLSFHGHYFKAFLMFSPINTVVPNIMINGISYKIYVNGVESSIPSSATRILFLALADSSTNKLHLVKNPIT